MLVLAGIAVLAAALEPAMPPLSGRARASDGDSLRLGDTRIRLLGLDAPELAQQCDTEIGEKWQCGHVARDRMAALLSAGSLACQPEGQDQYGRLLATCTIGSADLGAIMVVEGLAIASGAYRHEEEVARDARLGIWAGGFDSPRQWRDDHPRPVGALHWLWSWLP